jgi:hypothetical protein
MNKALYFQFIILLTSRLLQTNKYYIISVTKPKERLCPQSNIANRIILHLINLIGAKYHNMNKSHQSTNSYSSNK